MGIKYTQTLSELQEKIIRDRADEMAKYIDEGVLSEVLVEGGWTKIPFCFKNIDETVELYEWCEKTLTKNQWKYLAGAFVIRKKKEAEWFILRWE